MNTLIKNNHRKKELSLQNQKEKFNFLLNVLKLLKNVHLFSINLTWIQTSSFKKDVSFNVEVMNSYPFANYTLLKI